MQEVPPPDAPQDGEGTASEEAARTAEQLEAARRARLTRLRIAGFKSFAEPTVVEVMPGLTGIVGPNGCGKSNVVEALRWAMGETSARSLRGGEMDDIIFAGTATRPSRNLAEVTLMLEEASGLAPPPNADAADLEIVRRIARGEGSSFRVNGRELRARDVQTMFADIGSGARSSAMVSQGRVSALIQARPEERRAVLEEAAGIAGLRARRHEAELKLRQAEQNLARAEDLLGQLETQRQGLQRQARQAARYRNISGFVRGAETEWLAILRARAQSALSAARQAFFEARRTTGAAEAAAEAATLRAFAADRALPEPREAEGQARTALERRRVEAETIAAEEARAKGALEAATGRRDALLRDLDHAARAMADAEAAAARLTEEQAALRAAEEALPARSSDAAEAESRAAAMVAEAGRAAERATEAAAEAAARAEALAAEHEAAGARLARLRAESGRLEAERSQADAARVAPETLEAAEAAIAAAAETLSGREAALTGAEAARIAAQAAHEEARRRAAEAEAAHARANAELQGATDRARRAAASQQRVEAAHRDAEGARPAAGAREAAEAEAAAAEAGMTRARDALTAAEKSRADAALAHEAARSEASAAEAARARARAEVQALTEVLRARESGSALPPILDAVTVPAGLEAALGAALGEALESPMEAEAPRHWRALPPLDPPPPLPEGTTPLSRLVEAPPALARALSQVGLLPKGADGAALMPLLRPGQAVVTEGGAVWRWDGHCIREGAPTPGAVRLSQRNALRAAATRLDRAEAEAARCAGLRGMAAEAEQTRRTEEAAARQARAQAEARLTAARAAAAKLAAQDAEATARLASLSRDLAAIMQEREAAETALGAATAARDALPELPAARAARDAAREAEAGANRAEQAAREGRRGAEAALAAAREASRRLQARAAEAETRLAAILPQLARVAGEQAEAEAALAAVTEARAGLPDLGALREAVEAARRALASAREEEAAARAARAALAGEAERIAARLSAIAAEAPVWETRRADAAERHAELAARREAAEAEVTELEEAPAAAAAKRAAASRLLAEAEAAHREAAAALAAAEREQRESAEARRLADTAFATAREGQLRAQAAAEQAEAAAAGVEERIVERLGEGHPPLPAEVPEMTEAAEEKARRKLDRLAREREEMGPVNLRAEVELQELEARIATIVREREEIGVALGKLRGSIGHLNREGRERLRAVFDKVDAEFRGLFARLFGGGRAHLALVGSDDPLEAGLEIFAEPPGKKLSALSLLSGGEQALTALSLIFAVFRCQPAPVCVLDEVDAPLDDANVERLCDMLDAMASEGGTRFLVVTHHPLTMARMHRLYGVTMQERGVSRLLSVDLQRAVELVES